MPSFISPGPLDVTRNGNLPIAADTFSKTSHGNFFPIPSLFLLEAVENLRSGEAIRIVHERSNGSARLRVGALEADPMGCTLRLGDESAKLSPRAMKVLTYLAE